MFGLCYERPCSGCADRSGHRHGGAQAARFAFGMLAKVARNVAACLQPVQPPEQHASAASPSVCILVHRLCASASLLTLGPLQRSFHLEGLRRLMGAASVRIATATAAVPVANRAPITSKT